MTTDTKSKGHVEHTQAMENQIGLGGEMPRPIKVTIIGAGSTFTPLLVNDILRIPGKTQGEIALIDINESRLNTMRKLIELLLANLGREEHWIVTASTNRREALPGTNYLINTIEVSGLDCVRFDNDIPAKYGVDQCIGDTIGPGGLFKALRTIPSWLAILQDAEQLCPDAIVLNYTNPMNMAMLAGNRTASLQMVGLCHSVQGTGRLLAKRAGIPYEDMTWECAGINHLAWFTTLEHNGQDLYPLLNQKAHDDLAGNPSDPEDPADLVRKDMMLHFGAFITESSGHLSEYLPYYRKRADLLEQYARPGYDGESGFYANNWPRWRDEADAQRNRWLSGEDDTEHPRSYEYASWIIEGREKDIPVRIHGNVMNNHRSGSLLIGNLMDTGCVEVACMVDRMGIQPTAVGNLPPQMAALCDSNMRMFDLGATAAVERSKDAAIHALMLDPLTSAICSPAEIKQMTLELFEAEKDYLEDYS